MKEKKRGEQRPKCSTVGKTRKGNFGAKTRAAPPQEDVTIFQTESFQTESYHPASEEIKPPSEEIKPPKGPTVIHCSVGGEVQISQRGGGQGSGKMIGCRKEVCWKLRRAKGCVVLARKLWDDYTELRKKVKLLISKRKKELCEKAVQGIREQGGTT